MKTLRIAYVDGPRLRRTLVAACEYAQLKRVELNRINVFPVPDGDTGTNLALTVRAIADHLRGSRARDVATVAREAADAAVLGARGNCGMMLSHFLLGFAEAIGHLSRMSPREFRSALQAGVTHLYSALEYPVEGTILTVMRESAQAAHESEHRDFVPLVEEVVARARAALSRTPELLPVLKRAGVVDAGAKGFVSLLEGALLFIHGDPIVALDEHRGEGAENHSAAAEIDYPDAGERFRFCTEALVKGEALPSEHVVRDRLRDAGDSLIVIRSGNVLKVHVHTDEPARVFDWLRSVGSLVTHKAEDMQSQHAAVERAADGHVILARRPVAVVTDSASDLSEEVVRAHGIHVTPLLLVAEDRTYRDGLDITSEQFHALLNGSAGDLPTTSQPAPADFLATFRRAAEDGEELLAVTLGSALSGTFASADAAARRIDIPVHLVDSRGASLLSGLLTLKAAELVESGVPPSEAAEEVRRVRGQSGILFTVDTFDRLLASGRVGRGRALLGNVLSVKPILGLNGEGRVIPVDKVLGRRRVLPAVMGALEERIPRGAHRVRFGVVHVAAPEVVSEVEDALRTRWGRDVEILSAPATPVIATHIGAGAWGVAYMVED
ncbi:MAG: DegV family protein [Gemmatimonadota bacterium]|jgi:hypothetical protein